MNIIQPTRRGLITGLASLIAAPALVRASSIMPVKPWNDPLFGIGDIVYDNSFLGSVWTFSSLRHFERTKIPTVQEGGPSKVRILSYEKWGDVPPFMMARVG